MNFIKYEKIKEEDTTTRTIKIFNSVFIKSTCGSKKDEKTFFWGIIKTSKNKLEVPKIKLIKFFNLTFFKAIRQDWIEKFYLFGIYFYKKDHRKLFLKKYKKYIKPEDKNIFLLYGHHGETYCTSAFYIGTILKKYKNVKFFCFEQCHKKMFDLFWENILPPIEILEPFVSAYGEIEFYYKGIRVKKIIPASIQETKSEHIIDRYLKNLDFKREELYKKDFSLTEENRKSFRQKLEKMNLNLDNFVLLAPEVCTYGKLDDDFWIGLCQKLKERNFDIFVNITQPKSWADNLEHTFLTHKEIIQLAPHAKAIVSTRSGFSELMAYFNIPMHVIYQYSECYKKDNLEKTFNKYTLTKYPFVKENIIHEYNYLKEDNYNLIEKITASIK